MNQGVFDKLRGVIYEESGIVLTPEKKPLLETRLNRRLRSLQLTNEHDYLRYLVEDKSGEELIRLLDVVSTNVTYFWREPEHFEFLTQWVNARAESGKRSCRIWCAASSSGEEPYNIALILDRAGKELGLDWKILATDISLTVLRQAQQGIYRQEQLKDLPAELREQYFSKTEYEGEQRYQVAPHLKHGLLFKRLNLSAFPFPLKGPIDLIFCRNVMIYFDDGLRTKIIREFERLIPSGGHLILSKTESLLNIHSEFEPLGNSVYRRR